MKKRLALMLAGTMVLSAVPSIETFAATSSIGKGLIVPNPSNDTVYIGSNATITPGDLATPVGGITKVGTSSILRFASDAFIQEGSTLTITLENARWATDAELTSVNNGTVTTLQDEVDKVGTTFADSVTAGLQVRRLAENKIVVVATQDITPDTAKSIAIPADFVPTSSTGVVNATVTDSNLPGMTTTPIPLSRSIENATGVTADITPAKQESQVRAKDATVTLSENVQKQFLPNTTYTIALPSGYYFDAVAPAQFSTINTTATVQAKAGTQWATTGNIIEYSQPSNDKIEIHFSNDYVPGYTVSTLGSVLNVSGLVVNNSAGNWNTDVLATVYGNGVSHSSKIANFGTFNLKTETIGTPTKINAGTSAQNYVVFGNATTTPSAVKRVEDYTITANPTALTNTLRITETIPGSFRGGDVTIALPEGVDITGLKVVSASANTLVSGVNLADPTVAQQAMTAPSGYYSVSSPNYTGFEANTGSEFKNLTFKDNKVTIRGLASTDATKVIDLKVQLEVSANNDFTGDVVGTISSSNTVDIATPITTGILATFADVVDVNTSVKNLQVGLSSQKANDIIIRENASNTFRGGETFTVKLADEFTSSGYGITSAKVNVTGGNLYVDDVTINNKNTSNSTITFKVNGVTTGTDLGEITISDVMVYSDRSVPVYSNGTSVNVKISSDQTLQVPIEEEYIRFVSEGTNLNENNLNQNVVLYMGQSVAYVGDTTVNLLGSPYVSADGNTMVPVKGIGYALGIPETNVIYDPVQKQATFVLPTGKIAQIKSGSSYATINGMDIPLVDANGKLVSPVIKDGRFYLPLRATCSTIFGVDVEWVADKNAVIVNSNGTMPTFPQF